jgi:SAM-dependent methyltransferase
LKPLEQHQVEIERNKEFRAAKPLISRIYGDFYDRIVSNLNRGLTGAIVEIGSGSGELKTRIPEAICSDLFLNPWLDLVCDAYRLPFRDGTVSNLVLLDVFHHLVRPRAFLLEAERVLVPRGRVVLFEPYISLLSSVAYGLFHHEPIAWRRQIDFAPDAPARQDYYAAQGNATRLFFRTHDWLPERLRLRTAEAKADFAYLLSGGLSKPSLYPCACYPFFRGLDRWLSCAPGLFGGRCLVVIERA